MEKFQIWSYICTAVEEECHVRRMVVILIHLLQIRVIQIDNVLGFASRVESIWCSLKELLVYFADELSIRVLVSPLHLIQDNPF